MPPGGWSQKAPWKSWTSNKRCSTTPCFDSAYLVATLGEAPDQGRALRELRRVLKRGGRLVVGEVLLDPHRVSFGDLRRLTNTAGLSYERRVEGRLGYFASFRAL